MMDLRPELTQPLPERMLDLPVDKRGYPVPWFVPWVDGQPEFRLGDGKKWALAIREKLCWVCGGKLGRWKTFVIGPMCGITRITAEPGCHLDCARWSAVNCPFMARPRMVRRSQEDLKGLPDIGISGNLIDRNPGCMCLWTTDSFEIVDDGKGGPLILFGDRDSTEWYAEGRTATHAEVEESIRTGFPLLLAQAKSTREADDLERQRKEFLVRYLPA